MPIGFGTPEHWRDRAEEARKIAAQIIDPDASKAMMTIAENYEKIASRAAARQANTGPLKHSA